MIKLSSLLSESIIQEKKVYHGTISDFVDKIQQSKTLKSSRMSGNKISAGLTTESGIIWLTSEFDLANQYAHGAEVNMYKDVNVHGLKAEYGGVFEIEIDDNIKLINRDSPLTQSQVDILNKNFIPHYKPLNVGNTLSNAEWRSYTKHGLHDMILALGYDGIIYGKHQIGIAADSLPITAFHKKPKHELRKTLNNI